MIVLRAIRARAANLSMMSFPHGSVPGTTRPGRHTRRCRRSHRVQDTGRDVEQAPVTARPAIRHPVQCIQVKLHVQIAAVPGASGPDGEPPPLERPVVPKHGHGTVHEERQRDEPAPGRGPDLHPARQTGGLERDQAAAGEQPSRIYRPTRFCAGAAWNSMNGRLPRFAA